MNPVHLIRIAEELQGVSRSLGEMAESLAKSQEGDQIGLFLQSVAIKRRLPSVTKQVSP